MTCSLPHGIDAKVVVMGSTGVGKTSLLRQYSQNRYDASSIPTSAASFVTKKVYVDGIKVRLQLWDTSSHERFRSMAPMYYRGADAALLLYDTTDLSTFDDVRSWLEELKAHAPSLLIYIVGTKSDLGSRHQITTDLARFLLQTWFPLPRPTTPPSPCPSTNLSSRFSCLTFPFRALSSSLTGSPTKDVHTSSPLHSPLLATDHLFPPTPCSTPASDVSASPIASGSMTLHDKYGSIPRLRRALSEMAKSDSSRSSSPRHEYDNRARTLHQSKSWSCLRPRFTLEEATEHVSSRASQYEVVQEVTRCQEWDLPNRIELFQVSVRNNVGIEDLFSHLISALISRTEETPSLDTDLAHSPHSDTSSYEYDTHSRSSSLNPSPRTPPPIENAYTCMLESGEEDDYSHLLRHSPSWRCL